MEYLVAGAVALVISLINVGIVILAMMAQRRRLYDEYGEPRSTRRKKR